MYSWTSGKLKRQTAEITHKNEDARLKAGAT